MLQKTPSNRPSIEELLRDKNVAMYLAQPETVNRIPTHFCACVCRYLVTVGLISRHSLVVFGVAMKTKPSRRRSSSVASDHPSKTGYSSKQVNIPKPSSKQVDIPKPVMECSAEDLLQAREDAVARREKALNEREADLNRRERQIGERERSARLGAPECEWRLRCCRGTVFRFHCARACLENADPIPSCFPPVAPCSALRPPRACQATDDRQLLSVTGDKWGEISNST